MARLHIFAALFATALASLAHGAATQGRPDGGAAAEAQSAPALPAPATGAEALRNATSIFPRDPVSLYGSLILRRQSGVVVRETPFTMGLDWGANPPTAEYSVLDAFGRPLLSAKLKRLPDGESSLSFYGPDGKPADAPSMSAQIMGTDVTWLDITLAYLWWEDATLLEAAAFKGSLCDVVEVRPPSPIEGCASVRLWIDRKHGFLRQAEQFDSAGERVRWMWVASVGKIGDRWMIRNLEVKRPGTGLQTKLHIDDME